MSTTIPSTKDRGAISLTPTRREYVPITVGSAFGDKGSNPTEDVQLKDHLKGLEADNNELTSRVSNLEDDNALLKSEMEDVEKTVQSEGNKRKNGKNNNGQRNGQFPPPGNEFRAPVPAQGDIRSPCPAINTLANHGFINRDGTSILVGDLAQALEDIYRVSGETLIGGPIASAISLGLTVNDNGDDFLTIDKLFQNRDSTPNGFEAQEHDSSFFREDSDLGDDRPPSLRLIDDFFNLNGRAIIIPDEVMDYQRGRIQESCARHEAVFLPPRGGILVDTGAEWRSRELFSLLLARVKVLISTTSQNPTSARSSNQKPSLTTIILLISKSSLLMTTLSRMPFVIPSGPMLTKLSVTFALMTLHSLVM